MVNICTRFYKIVINGIKTLHARGVDKIELIFDSSNGNYYIEICGKNLRNSNQHTYIIGKVPEKCLSLLVNTFNIMGFPIYLEEKIYRKFFQKCLKHL